jgi:hypothetical protein
MLRPIGHKINAALLIPSLPFKVKYI